MMEFDPEAGNESNKELLIQQLKEAKNAAGKVLDPIVQEMHRAILWNWIVGVGIGSAVLIMVAIMFIPEFAR